MSLNKFLLRAISRSCGVTENLVWGLANTVPGDTSLREFVTIVQQEADRR